MTGPNTLTVDCGGTALKAAVVDSEGTRLGIATRQPTRYPLSPDAFIATVDRIRTRHARGPAQIDRVTVGLPGMIRHGVVIHTPHYITRAGPRTKVDPGLARAWAGFDVRGALAQALGLPVLVANDAEVHGAGVVSGLGLEVVFTLGTGLGSAVFDSGRLAPHQEWSHAPISISRGATYDSYLGEAQRRRIGNALWSRRVLQAIDGLRPVFWWDRLYLGGGNTAQLTPSALRRLGADVTVVPNAVAHAGGARVWDWNRPT